MKKNGFTLIELLAVVIIIGITITLVMVKVDNNLKDTSRFADNETKKMIEDAANIYLTSYGNELLNLKNLNVDYVSVETLINKGILKKKSVKNISKNSVVIIANNNNNIKMKYSEELIPVIFLNGSEEISIYQNKAYIELGAFVAIPDVGITELENSNIESTVNSTVVGKYDVNYSFQGAKTIKRIVDVISN